MLKLRCDVGVFLLEQQPNGNYHGEANGIRIDIDSDSIILIHGMESHILFYEDDFEENLLEIRDKIDAELAHLLENDDEDVQYLQTSNGKVAFYQYNTHLPGDPVIFLHGGPGGESNTAKARRLRLDRPVFLYDQSGSGRSDKIKDLKSWNHESFAKELNEIVEKMGFRRFSFAAASWGAGLAALYAIRYGCSKIESMMLVSPFFSTRQWESDAMENLSKLGPDYVRMMEKCIRGQGTRDDYVKVMREYDAHFLFSQECNREIAYASAEEEPNEVFRAMVGDNEMHTAGNMRDFEIVDNLGKITVPVLMLNGDSDEVLVKTAESYQRKIRGSELRIIRNAGHALSSEQFEAYADEARGFL